MLHHPDIVMGTKKAAVIMFIIEISRGEIKNIVYCVYSLGLKIKIVNRAGFIGITDGKIIFFKSITSLHGICNRGLQGRIT
jgi:hypothetical protein